VTGVVSKAALAKGLPEPSLLAVLRRVPSLGWIAGLLGIGLVGLLPFFGGRALGAGFLGTGGGKRKKRPGKKKQ
jgi:hypothetical protein